MAHLPNIALKLAVKAPRPEDPLAGKVNLSHPLEVAGGWLRVRLYAVRARNSGLDERVVAEQQFWHADTGQQRASFDFGRSESIMADVQDDCELLFEAALMRSGSALSYQRLHLTRPSRPITYRTNGKWFVAWDAYLPSIAIPMLLAGIFVRNGSRLGTVGPIAGLLLAVTLFILLVRWYVFRQVRCTVTRDMKGKCAALLSVGRNVDVVDAYLTYQVKTQYTYRPQLATTRRIKKEESHRVLLVLDAFEPTEREDIIRIPLPDLHKKLNQRDVLACHARRLTLERNLGFMTIKKHYTFTTFGPYSLP